MGCWGLEQRHTHTHTHTYKLTQTEKKNTHTIELYPSSGLHPRVVSYSGGTEICMFIDVGLLILSLHLRPEDRTIDYYSILIILIAVLLFYYILYVYVYRNRLFYFFHNM